MPVKKPKVIPVTDRVRLDCTQEDAVVYLVETYGPLDARGVTELYAKHYAPLKASGVISKGVMFASLEKAGRITRIARGMYAGNDSPFL